MARIIPSDWHALQISGAAGRELETLEKLANGLLASLTVFHGVHWTRIEAGRTAFPVFGDISFVILAPSGRLMLIEQQSGFLDEGELGLISSRPTGERQVALQLRRTRQAIAERLAPLLAGEPLVIDTLLYCPDYTVREPGSAGLAPEHIVDASRRDQLCSVIASAFLEETPRPALAMKLRRFFSDELQLVPDVSNMVGRAHELVTRLSGGLTTWARRLDFSPFRLRVIGTAGSGKTQLALALLRDAQREGRRALYVCFNRPLADHLSSLVANGEIETSRPAHRNAIEIMSFHQFCDHRLRAAGVTPDYSRSGEFDAIARRFATLAVAVGDCFDDLIVDEGQDFEQAWVKPLRDRLTEHGRLWWLEDPMQNLYGRPAVGFDDGVTMHADANFRSPRAVLAEVDRLCLPTRKVEAASPVDGDPIDWRVYEDAPGLIESTKRAVSDALLSRFRRDDVAIVTFSGRQKSRLMRFDRIGPYRLRAFSGRYDLFGNAEYDDGDVLIETVYRFKGQSAPCVVLTEVDFDVLDEQTRRKLFVGLTRASMKLIVVVSARAAAACQLLPVDRRSPARAS